ncbi:hypothetical protein ADIARSV_0005 [Arcticibacter svalbardensis MN12-7]|uniref:DUF4349 domain-containing protein n=1 Tax=Arcticibacter svalbardensis MN12-7 TaxID=1150600 RepID=R9GY61_9SPHI|nr:DUF4349 domain-containing protein [Arcticibacter svalbardensis]EOR96742.1 hypothetical protein ADIARSV_0005 [Arcticibacter svalbardensis MN12-7]
MKNLNLFGYYLIITGLICSCNTNRSEKEIINTSVDTLSASGLVGISVKLIKTASIDFKVKNVFESAKHIVSSTHKMNGLVLDRHIESVDENSKSLAISDDSVQLINSYVVKANMLVSVPTEKLDGFIDDVSASAAHIQDIQLKIEDKSLDYLAGKMKQQNHEQLLQYKAGKNHKTNESISLLEQNNKLVDQQVKNKKIDADVNYSSVQLSFYQNPLVRSEVMARDDLSGYRLPFLSSIRNSFFNGWYYFLTFIIGAVSLWMFILAGVVIIFTYRYFKFRKVSAV